MTDWTATTKTRPLLEDQVIFLQETSEQIKGEMKGIDGIINALLVALVTRGHVLLEGNPGLGKTALVRSLSRALELGEHAVGRIQFTPDLMPSDITGTKMPKDEDINSLAFKPGPIFHQLLLADEINRATPKTQSAMLEAMAEFQVTVLGETHPLTKMVHLDTGLDAPTPFMVMATQNPVELEGTYPLPEAQLDRFIMKLRMPFPKAEILQLIVDKDASAHHEPAKPSKMRADGDFVDNNTKFLRHLALIERAIRSNRPTAAVQTHILNIVMATTDKLEQVAGLEKKRLEELRKIAGDVDYPLGPRAATSMTLATLAWSAVAEVEPSEAMQFTTKSTNSLAKIVVPTLRHRIRFRTGWGIHNPDTADQAEQEELTESDQHDDQIRRLAAACAPDDSGYFEIFAEAIEAARDVAL